MLKQHKSVGVLIYLDWATLKYTKSFDSCPVFVIGADSSDLNTPWLHTFLFDNVKDSLGVTAAASEPYRLRPRPGIDNANYLLKCGLIDITCMSWIISTKHEGFSDGLVFSKHSIDSYLICVLSPRLFNRL